MKTKTTNRFMALMLISVLMATLVPMGTVFGSAYTTWNDITGTSSLTIPNGVATDPCGNVYVANTGLDNYYANTNKIKKYSNGTWSAVTGTGNILLKPTGIAVDPNNGDLYVTEVFHGSPATKRVSKLNNDVWSTVALNAGVTLINPRSIAVDASSNLYVADSGNDSVPGTSRIYKYTSSSNLWSDITNGWSFTMASAIAVDPSGNIYAADWKYSGNFGKVVKLPSGSSSWTDVTGTLAGKLTLPQGLAADGLGDVYLTDNTTISDKDVSKVYRFSNGVWQDMTNGESFGAGALHGIAVDGHQHLYTVEGTAQLPNKVRALYNTDFSYGIASIANQSLTKLTSGYASGTQQTRTIKVTSTGTGDVSGLTVTSSDTDKFIVTQPNTPLCGMSSTTTFTVKAKDNLPVGTHTTTVTVSAPRVASKSFTVTQIVDPSYKIAPVSNQTLQFLKVGYAVGTQEEKTIDISSAGTGVLNNLTITSSDTTKFVMTPPAVTTLNPSASTSLKIRAKDNLPVGTHTTTITISADNMPNTTFTVTQKVGSFDVAPIVDQALKDLSVNYTLGTQENRVVTIKASGTETLTDLAVTSSDMTNFVLTPPSGTTLNANSSKTFMIKVKDNLPVGTYETTITISATNMTSKTFKVTQIVTATPLTYDIAAIADQTLNVLAVGYTSGAQETKEITVTSTGTGSIVNLSMSSSNMTNFAITPLAATSLSPGNTTTFKIGVRNNLPVGTYETTITLSAANMTSKTFKVTQTVSVAGLTYDIAAIADQTLSGLTDGYTSGSQEEKEITLTSTGTGTLNSLDVTSNDTMNFDLTLPTVTSLNPNGSTTFKIKAKDNLPVGTYETTINVSAANMTNKLFKVAQTVSVVGLTYDIAAIADQTLSGLTDGYTSGSQEEKEITLTSTGTGTLNSLDVTSSDTVNFDLTLPTVTSLNPSGSTTFKIKAKDNLPVGTYETTITISAANMTSKTFKVTQTVSAAGLTYDIASIADQTLSGLTDGYTSGSQEEKEITLTSTGTGTLNSLDVTSSDTVNFDLTLPSVTTLNPNGSATFKIKAKINLPVGTYETTITISAANMTSKTFKVTQTVSAAGLTYDIASIADQTLSGLTKGYTSGSRDEKEITITSTGTDVLNSLNVTSSDTANFVLTPPSVTSLSPSSSTTFKIKATNGLPVGTYETTITVSAANMTSKTFKVTQVVNASPSSSGGGGGSNPIKEFITVDVEDGSRNSGEVVSKATIERTTDANGNKKDSVTFTTEQAAQTTEQLKAAGSNTAKIVIPDKKDEVSELNVKLPLSSTSTLAGNGMNLEINTPNARVLIPSDSLKGLIDDVYFRFIPIKKEAERKEVEQRARTEQVVRIVAGNDTVTVVGRPMTIETNMQSRQVTLTIPLPENELTNDQLKDLGIFIEHSDGEKELVKGEIVPYDQTGKLGIRFTINKFSTFTVIHMDGWQQTEVAGENAHHAYIKGYPDGTFRPKRAITRVEMAAILSRVMDKEKKLPIIGYSDVKATHWASESIAKVTQMGLMRGYPDGSFKPEQTITRGEMANIALQLLTKDGTASSTFPDVAGHWAEHAIVQIYAAGIIVGFEDGTFRPDDALSRAEAVTIINKLLGRGPLVGAEKQWADVSMDHWAYADIQEASSYHAFEKNAKDVEQWVPSH